MYVMRYVKSIPIKRHLCLQVAKSKYEEDSIKPAGVCSSSLKMAKITCHKIKQLRMTGIGLFIVRLGMFYNVTKILQIFSIFRPKKTIYLSLWGSVNWLKGTVGPQSYAPPTQLISQASEIVFILINFSQSARAGRCTLAARVFGMFTHNKLCVLDSGNGYFPLWDS